MVLLLLAGEGTAPGQGWSTSRPLPRIRRDQIALGAPLVRVMAVAEHSEVQSGRVQIVETLDVFNDHWHLPLTVTRVQSEYFTVHNYYLKPEGRLFMPLPLEIPPGEVRRVVLRRYQLPFKRGRSWYERYIRFRVHTDRGLIISNKFMAPVPLPDHIPSGEDGSVFER